MEVATLFRDVHGQPTYEGWRLILEVEALGMKAVSAEAGIHIHAESAKAQLASINDDDDNHVDIKDARYYLGNPARTQVTLKTVTRLLSSLDRLDLILTAMITLEDGTQLYAEFRFYPSK